MKNDRENADASAMRALPQSTRYEAPRLERLGAWSALTLQQSIPIGPGTMLNPSGPLQHS
jgi:hypothetical protein